VNRWVAWSYWSINQMANMARALLKTFSTTIHIFCWNLYSAISVQNHLQYVRYMNEKRMCARHTNSFLSSISIGPDIWNHDRNYSAIVKMRIVHLIQTVRSTALEHRWVPRCVYMVAVPLIVRVENADPRRSSPRRIKPMRDYFCLSFNLELMISAVICRCKGSLVQ